MKILTSLLVQLCFTHCISQFTGTLYDTEELGESTDLDYDDTFYTNQQEDEYGKTKRGARRNKEEGRKKENCVGKPEGPPRFIEPDALIFQSARNQGSRHALYCPYTSCPKSNMTWIKDGEIVRKRPEGFGKSEIQINRNKFRIIINNNKKEDDGMYTCLISNQYGSINHTIEVKSIEVRYKQKPRIKEELTNQTVLIGSNLTISCEPDIEDNDAINIHWFRNYKKNGSFTDEKGLVYSVALKTIEETKLELYNLQVNDSTYYTCQMENYYGSTLSSVYIDVVETLDPPQNSISLALYFGGAGAALICLLSVCLCLYYRRKSRKSNKDKQKAIDNAMHVAAWVKQVLVIREIGSEDLLNPVIKIEKIRIEANLADETAPLSEFKFPVDITWEFPRDLLVIHDVLGEGAFGRVMKGTAYAATDNGRLCLDKTKLEPETVETTVAVKMVKEGHTDHDILDLVKEMEIMKAIGRHSNIINLLGVCAQPAGYPLLVIVEYARYGNLRDFLKLRKPKTQEHLKEQRRLGYPPEDRAQLTPPLIEDVHEETRPVSLKQMLSFALQVAKGMEFLSSRKCVHRDLAARNVLVADNFILKIADFGMARDVQDTEYYRKESEGRLPIKWMAPESLFERVSTTMSDVWSFGILFWEIVTFGDTPYREEYLPKVFMELVRNGYKMKRPLGCPENVYNVMNKCWGYQAVNRPCWSELVSVLYTLHNEADPDEYLDLNVPDLETPPSSPELEPFTRIRNRSDRLALSSSLYVLPNEAADMNGDEAERQLYGGTESAPLLEKGTRHKYIQVLPPYETDEIGGDDVFSPEGQGHPMELSCYELDERGGRQTSARSRREGRQTSVLREGTQQSSGQRGGRLSQLGGPESIYPSPVSLQHPSSTSLTPEAYPVMYTALRSAVESPEQEDIYSRQFTTFKPDKKRGSSESGYGTNRDSESSDSRYRVYGIDKIRHASESDSVFFRNTPSPTSE